MSGIIITGKDYNNLNITYSNSNHIDNVIGTEYNFDIENVNLSFSNYDNELIDANGNTSFEYNNGGTILFFPEPLGKVNGVFSNDIINENGLNANDLFMDYYSQKYKMGFFDRYIRQELGEIIIKFAVKTNEILGDEESLDIKCEIEYEQYRNTGELQYLSNLYNSDKQLIFNIIRTSDITPTTGNTNGYEGIPIEQSRIYDLLGTKIAIGFSKTPFTLVEQYRTTDISGTIIHFILYTAFWTGYNIYNSIPQYENILNIAKKFKFSVVSSAIQEKNREFSYGDGENIYELESNELLQYTDTTPTEDLLSYKISQKIMEEFKNNRQVVSFTLLNCTNRLKPGDLIKIKDVNDEYLGKYYDSNGNIQISYFEVISYRPRWNGKYYAEVICRQKY